MIFINTSDEAEEPQYQNHFFLKLDVDHSSFSFSFKIRLKTTKTLVVPSSPRDHSLLVVDLVGLASSLCTLTFPHASSSSAIETEPTFSSSMELLLSLSVSHLSHFSHPCLSLLVSDVLVAAVFLLPVLLLVLSDVADLVPEPFLILFYFVFSLVVLGALRLLPPEQPALLLLVRLLVVLLSPSPIRRI